MDVLLPILPMNILIRNKMAKIINAKTKESEEVKDGDYIQDACEKLGVNFACSSGMCGSCQIKILEGEDNLSDLTQEEKEIDLNKKSRLACQCKIKSGKVVIDF